MRLARLLVIDVLDEAGHPDLSDAAALLISELVTNAVLHARTGIDVRVSASGQGVHVAVTDHSPLRPQRRSYGTSATTGRGLALIDMIAERSGTHTEADGGKTTWFELGTPDATVREEQPEPRADAAEPLVDVVLLGTPIRLAQAWQQHAGALLREHLLSCYELDRDVDVDVDQKLAQQAEASEAFSELAEAFDDAPATDGHIELTLRLTPARSGRFSTLDRMLDEIMMMAERGELLATSTQPEIRMLRRWLCSQIDGQLSGAMPAPWAGLASETVAAPQRPVVWDVSGVRASELAVIAADDSNRIIASSAGILDLLGWSEDELLSRRVVSIIPPRFREDHVAAFTLQMLSGRSTILDRHVEVVALHRDGSELPVDLLVRREQAGGGRAVFVATFAALG